MKRFGGKKLLQWKDPRSFEKRGFGREFEKYPLWKKDLVSIWPFCGLEEPLLFFLLLVFGVVALGNEGISGFDFEIFIVLLGLTQLFHLGLMIDSRL